VLGGDASSTTNLDYLELTTPKKKGQMHIVDHLIGLQATHSVRLLQRRS
jgi:hypothetical protein